jgi:hypothetical protein
MVNGSKFQPPISPIVPVKALKNSKRALAPFILSYLGIYTMLRLSFILFALSMVSPVARNSVSACENQNHSTEVEAQMLSEMSPCDDLATVKELPKKRIRTKATEVINGEVGSLESSEVSFRIFSLKAERIAFPPNSYNFDNERGPPATA